MFRVWDYDKDGYVSLRDFVHTFVYAKRVDVVCGVDCRDLSWID